MPSVTIKGQVTIPKRIRDQLGIRPGDEVNFIMDGERVVVEAVPHHHRSFYRLLPRRAAARVIDMDAAVLAEVAAADRRTRRKARRRAG